MDPANICLRLLLVDVPPDSTPETRRMDVTHGSPQWGVVQLGNGHQTGCHQTGRFCVLRVARVLFQPSSGHDPLTAKPFVTILHPFATYRQTGSAGVCSEYSFPPQDAPQTARQQELRRSIHYL